MRKKVDMEMKMEDDDGDELDGADDDDEEDAASDAAFDFNDAAYCSLDSSSC